MDSLIADFNNKSSIVWKPTDKFCKDIYIIISEILRYNTFINLDIYEILVSSGHDLTWNVSDYNITNDDLNWFKNEGKYNFITSLNKFGGLINMAEYNSIMNIHSKLVELFELQL